MSKGVVKSKKDTKTYSFIDYAYSKEVVRDFPKILNYYDKLIPVLRQYQQYTGVWEVLQATEDSRAYMQIQYEYYKRIYETKGKMSNE